MEIAKEWTCRDIVRPIYIYTVGFCFFNVMLEKNFKLKKMLALN